MKKLVRLNGWCEGGSSLQQRDDGGDCAALIERNGEP